MTDSSVRDGALSPTARVTAADVRRYRAHVQGLGPPSSGRGAAILDLGVQDTGGDGAGWALAIRGLDLPEQEAVLVWGLRGAPHVYRRRDIGAVAAALTPTSEAEAQKRVLNAAKPLRAAGISAQDALDTVAEAMRDVVRRPTAKGAVSSALTARLPAAYLRPCRPCNATHIYELPFRLGALRAGLELEPGTSPPVLRRIPGWRGPDRSSQPRFDPIRLVLHLLGPATPKMVADHLDSPVAAVKARWPPDAVPVAVDGQRRDVLDADLAVLTEPPETSDSPVLLGGYDLFLQGRDREVIAPDTTRHAELWPVLGRPGVVLHRADLVGTWRPRMSGGALRLAVRPWLAHGAMPDLQAAAEALAAYRGVRFAGFVTDDASR